VNPSLPQPALGEAEIARIRAHHKGTRTAGIIACLIGVLVMVAGRFMAGAPVWLVSVGVGIAVLGWGLIAFALISRLALARALVMKARG
jgi:hypothetical protein